MNQDNENKTTHFGYQKVPSKAKSALVAHVFQSVANKYDLMNDLMSFGLHRLWKRFMIAKANVRPGQYLLDVASGTGDLAYAFANRIGQRGKVIMTDIEETMLSVGIDKLTDAGKVGNVFGIQADAEALPFHDNYFDCETMAFGLRNVTHKEAALRSLLRVLKPGGQLLILDFSHPALGLLNKIYDFYSFHCIPKMGELIANDKASYQYLVESIRMHPDQETLKGMLVAAGFSDVDYFNLSGGIVALHRGYKY